MQAKVYDVYVLCEKTSQYKICFSRVDIRAARLYVNGQQQRGRHAFFTETD